MRSIKFFWRAIRIKTFTYFYPQMLLVQELHYKSIAKIAKLICDIKQASSINRESYQSSRSADTTLSNSEGQDFQSQTQWKCHQI